MAEIVTILLTVFAMAGGAVYMFVGDERMRELERTAAEFDSRLSKMERKWEDRQK
jgi:uncharacterized membrane protein (DUF106 family)